MTDPWKLLEEVKQKLNENVWHEDKSDLAHRVALALDEHNNVDDPFYALTDYRGVVGNIEITIRRRDLKIWDWFAWLQGKGNIGSGATWTLEEAKKKSHDFAEEYK
jgi:hypothetical protein